MSSHTRNHQVWDQLLERVFEAGFLMWSESHVYQQAIGLWLFRIGERVK